MIPQIETKVLRAELDDIERRRNLVFRPDAPVTVLPDRPADAEEPHPDAQPDERVRQLDAVFERSHAVRPFGVAFSGGGIRSATFNLGVLQGLANKGLLPYVDYLSTVSGGGYIGSWLHGLIRNHCDGDVQRAQEVLSTLRNTVSASAEFDPVTFLRKYSNYLAPRPGLFSLDTWVIGSIWVRNVLLNQLILLPTLGALVLLVLFAGYLSQRQISPHLADFQSVLAVVTLGIATLITAANLRAVVAHPPSASAGGSARDGSGGGGGGTLQFLRALWDRVTVWAIDIGELAAVATFAGAAMIALKGQPERAAIQAEANTFASLLGEMPVFSVQNATARLMSLVAIPVLFAALQAIGGFPACYRRLRRRADGRVSTISWVLSYLHILWMMALASAVTVWLIYLVVTMLPIATATTGAGGWIRIGFGPPLVSICILSGGSLLIGLMGADYPDAAREWLARIGSIIALLSTAWLGLFVIAVYGPFLVAWTLSHYAPAGWSAIAGWMLTTGLGVLAGHSGRTNGQENEDGSSGGDNGGDSASLAGGMASLSLHTLIAVAPVVFMIGYLLLISTGAHVAIRAVSPIPYPAPAPSTVASFQATYWDGLSAARWGLFATEPKPDESRLETLQRVVQMSGTRTTLALGAICLVIAGIASWRFNINEFSLHHFYKNRLVRCYLGASHARERKPNRMTGFDPSDDFPISALVPVPQPQNGVDAPWLWPGLGREQAQRQAQEQTQRQAQVQRQGTQDVPSVRPPYCGPYAILNTALNLNAGSELAQQERKSTSFVFTPRFCGFQPFGSRAEQKMQQEHDLDPSGYRDSSAQAGKDGVGFMFPDGPRLGTVMAISGAAANPNDGYHTSGPMAFLLTVFDARLGWWVGNPRNPRTLFTRISEACRRAVGVDENTQLTSGASRTPGPRSAWFYLFAELLGRTTSRSRYINLSDGGHFENLGLYELVRRRCRYIIVGDAEQDEGMTFESLGGAIRKCRADFGVEIDIDPTPIRLGGDGLSRAHCVVGTICYPEREKGLSPGLTDGEFEQPPLGRTNARGWILYLKASLTGDEPTDVRQYRDANSTFPQQSTGDQFFSESQFESYRRLGLHVATDAFDRIDQPWQTGEPDVLRRLFQQLSRKWYGPTPASEETAARLAEQYMSLMQRIAAREPPATFERQMLPALDVPPVASAATPLATEQIVLGVEAIQLMEDVFVAFGLELQANRMNPHNAGWMQLFRRWVKRDVRQTVLYAQIWPRVRRDYNPMFQNFVDVDLLHDPSADWPERP